MYHAGNVSIHTLETKSRVGPEGTERNVPCVIEGEYLEHTLGRHKAQDRDSKSRSAYSVLPEQGNRQVHAEAGCE